MSLRKWIPSLVFAITVVRAAELAAAEPVSEPSATPGSVSRVTYHRDVARILQKHCVSCHRAQAIAPFALDSFDAVVDYAPMIQDVIRRETMPPWFAAPAEDSHPGPWANERSLSADEKSVLTEWIEAGRSEGDPADAPEPVVYPDGWQIGTPDAVFGFAEPFPVDATGVISYQYIPVETNLEEDRWVEAIEFRPGVAEVVHHILVFVMTPEMTRRDLERAGAINYWAVYVPGNNVQVYPEGHARRLQAGSKLIFQMHYTPMGTAVEDRTQIALRFAKSPPKYEVKTKSIVKSRFEIPPGAANYQISETERIKKDMRVLGYLPHHHVRGVAARYELLTADGASEMLLDVPRYDFNWQLFYQYRTPRIIPAGSAIRYTAWYDNSANNPANPDPTQSVHWGPQTFDEMHLGYVEYTVPLNEESAASSGLSRERAKQTANRE